MRPSTRSRIFALPPNGETVIVIDHDGLRNYLAGSRRGMPFVERDGRYWGLPEDDAEAVRELERQRKEAPAQFLALATSSLWFLDRFPVFCRVHPLAVSLRPRE